MWIEASLHGPLSKSPREQSPSSSPDLRDHLLTEQWGLVVWMFSQLPSCFLTITFPTSCQKPQSLEIHATSILFSDLSCCPSLSGLLKSWYDSVSSIQSLATIVHVYNVYNDLASKIMKLLNSIYFSFNHLLVWLQLYLGNILESTTLNHLIDFADYKVIQACSS